MSSELMAQGPVTPIMLIEQAINKGADIAVVERMVALQREIREYEAKIAFDAALNRCQKLMTRISTDAQNTSTKSRYASYAQLDRALKPIYTAEGFSLSFGEDAASTVDVVVMLGYLSREGHQRIFRKTIPVDPNGPKGNVMMTKTHASGSAGSYAKRYLLKDIFNVAVGEDDDDGNGGGKQMPTEDLIAYTEAIENASTLKELKDNYEAAYRAADGAGDRSAIDRFITLKDARKKELA